GLTALMAGCPDSAATVEYTAIGDTVNVASRVEGLTKDFGVELLLTSAVAEALGGRWPLRSVGRAPVRGRAGEVELSTIDQPA
ncbi:MAG TPA: adenylate/guanylate cyclase domain-containing protein, partial [Myxococcota bacterium]|nr:adenylate/guanylate cyclase domain-containing protein [Myxococcota bacterium]